MLCVAELSGRLIDVNPAWESTLGWTVHELRAVPYVDLVHPDDVAATLEETKRLGEGRATVHFENRYQRKDGTYAWLSWRAVAAPAGDEPDSPQLIFAAAREVTARKEMETQLRHQASHDTTTGLLNRRRFEEELAAQIARCRRYEEHAAVFVLDLDHFKEVNDSHGHDVGDELLRHVASTLAGCLRDTDSLARMGGDEFAILLPHMAPDAAADTAERLRRCLAETPLRSADEEIAVAASVGIAFIDKSATDGHDVMVAADRAMYDAKALGRNRISGLRRPAGPSATVTRVFHCDDSAAYRRLLMEMLRAHGDITLVGAAPSLALALEAPEIPEVDVILLDAIMGHADPAAFVASLRERNQTARIVVLSGLDECPPVLETRVDGVHRQAAQLRRHRRRDPRHHADHLARRPRASPRIHRIAPGGWNAGRARSLLLLERVPTGRPRGPGAGLRVDAALNSTRSASAAACEIASEALDDPHDPATRVAPDHPRREGVRHVAGHAQGHDVVVDVHGPSERVGEDRRLVVAAAVDRLRELERHGRHAVRHQPAKPRARTAAPLLPNSPWVRNWSTSMPPPPPWLPNRKISSRGAAGIFALFSWPWRIIPNSLSAFARMTCGWPRSSTSRRACSASRHAASGRRSAARRARPGSCSESRRWPSRGGRSRRR